jgi:MFS transporter, FSR family, fosmidomycin resistance protein
MMPASARRAVGFVNLGHAFAHLFMLLYPTVVLALEAELDMGYAELLPLAFPGYLLFGIGSLPAGWLADRWSTPLMMSVYLLGTGAAVMLVGLADTPFQIGAALTLMGLLASIYHPVAIAWLVGATDRPGRALGVNGVYGAIGTGAAAVVAGGLIDLVSWRAAFLVPGALCFGLGIAFEVSRRTGFLVMERVRTARRTASAAEAAATRQGLLLLFVTMTCAGTIYQMTAVGLPKIFQVRVGPLTGEGVLAIGSLVSLVYLLSAFGQVVGGMLADRFDQRRVYLASYASQVLALALAAVTGDALIVLVAILAVTLNMGTQPVENYLLARYTPEHWRATVYGLKFVLALGLSALGVPLLAWLFAGSGDFRTAFFVMAGLALVIATVALALPPPGGRRPAPPPPVAQPAE